VAIALTPIELGASPAPTATPIGLRAAQPSEPVGKIWSARTTTLNDVVGSPTRRTVAIEPDSTVPGADGVWLFTDVLQGQSYEVSFSSPGYDTQSFVLTPRADGEPIDLDVVMKPANGSLSGTVVGPSGPLGGAEIRITDGTLEFVSTSASGSGTWSLSGVSTPGVYTVTATLRGFATAVRQVRLAPGDTPTGITLQMVPGLGTITGLVTTNGSGLGGVTVTASNGETTLTTTTLTEGNIGFYSLPQLPAPAEYTVQAQLDGYVTNSRRVPLSGSLSGVDFSMTSTTSTLTGRVLSSGGGGIESAGLIVSTGELQFRASTSPTGAFEIDRLPPGDYTITVEHFQHDSVTEFTTLTAGSAPTPLTITLPLSTGPSDVGTGSLVVSVINEDSTIVPAGINNARVTLSRNRSDDVRVLQDPDASAVTFEDLPIGTWTINVTAEGYNVSAPITRSVGLARERAEIRLQKLGSASGTMVNSLTGTPLTTGYTVNLFRLQNDTDTVGVPVGSFPGNATGTWTTPPAALPTGVYRIQASSPLGFFVRNDQILDTSPEVRNRTMSFLVPVLTDAEVKPLVIPPIEADPYPTITGKIYKPRLNVAAVEYDAVDEPSLAVTGVCNGDPIPAGDISITDAFGPTGGAADLFDTFSIAKEAVAELIPVDELPGTCSFTVGADNRIDATISLANIQPSDGRVSSDRLAAAALVRTPEPLTGTVFWFDKGIDPDARVPLGNVAIAAAAPVITGFASTERSSVLPDPRPVPVLGPSTATSTPTTSTTPGAWTLTGQVFGVSNYVFTTPNFTPGSVPVTISGTARIVPPTGTNANILTEPVDGTGFGIELTPPNPGTISGRVTIQTIDTPKYGTDMVNATDPTGAPVTRTPRAAVSVADPGGEFTFADAIAGTWNITFDELANHVREPAGTTPPPNRPQLLPGGTVTGVDATYTELATVRVRLFDKTSLLPIEPAAMLALTEPAAPELNDDVPAPADTTRTDNVYELTGIPVAKTAPTTTEVEYRLALELPGYDLLRARTGSDVLAPVVDARNLALPLVAGRVTTFDLYIDSLKSITGSITGVQTGDLPDAPGVLLPLSGPAALDVVRINPAPGDLPFEVKESISGGFEIIGPPGQYQLTPSHPEYQDFPAQIVTLGASSNVPLAPFKLILRQSKLSVDALTQLAGGTNVDGAVFDRYLGTAPCTGFPAPPERVDIPTVGPAVIDIAPGNYCLRISKFERVDGVDTTKEIAFPAIVSVTVPRSTAATPGLATVVAPLPALRPSLTGTLIAKNANGGIVELFADPVPELSLAFTQDVSVSVNGTTIPNQNPNSTADDTATATPPPVAVPPAEQTEFAWTYEFTNVPYGENKITAPVITGYRPDTTTTQTVVVVDDFGPTEVPEFVYTIDNSSVEIALGPGAFPSLDLAYKDTDERAVVNLVSKTNAGSGVPRPYTFNATTNTLTILDLAYEAGLWTLIFDDALHAPVSAKVNITSKPDANGIRTGTFTSGQPVGDRVRVTGQVTQQSTAAETSITELSGTDAAMNLVGPAGTPNYTLTPAAPIISNGKLIGKSTYSIYFFDVGTTDLVAGNYVLTTTKIGYDPVRLGSLDLRAIGLGKVLANQNVAIKKNATIMVRASNRGLALPTGLQAKLLNTTLPFRVVPAALLTGATNPTATFSVPAGTYGAQTVSTVTAPYPEQRSTLPDSEFGIDANATIDLELPRITRFEVTGPTSATEVTVTMATQTPKKANAGTAIEFSESETTTGTTATVSATGFRTATVTVPDQLVSTVPVTLLPTTVVGAITAANEVTGNVLQATSGGTMLQGSITGNKYRVEGLVPNTDGTDRIWTITYTKPGVGTGSTSVTVTTTGPVADATGTIAGGTITVMPRDVNYDFTVTTPIIPVPTDPPLTDDVAGAIVTIFNSSGTSIGTDTTADGSGGTVAGTARITVKENTAPATWTVAKTGFLTKSGTISSPPVSATIPPVSLQPQWEVTGTVFDSASTPGPVVGARIDVCPANPATRCTATGDRTTTTVAGGAYTLRSDLSQGSYRIWASSAGKEQSIVLTVDAAGAATTTPTNGRINLPA
jgi:hypothetical protein